jgi:predicted Zn-dependent protease
MVGLARAIAARLAGMRLATSIGLAPWLIALACAAAGTMRVHARWRDPVGVYAHAVVSYPPNGLAVAGLCGELVRAGDLERAIMACTRAERIYPIDPTSHCMHAEALCRSGRIDEAKRVMAEALANYPGSIDVWLCDGNVAWFTDDLERARRAYTHVLAREPTSDTARLYLADVLLRLGNRPQALALVATFRNAPPILPEHQKLLGSLAVRAHAASSR